MFVRGTTTCQHPTRSAFVHIAVLLLDTAVHPSNPHTWAPILSPSECESVSPLRHITVALRPDDELAIWITLRSSGEAYLPDDISTWWRICACGGSFIDIWESTIPLSLTIYLYKTSAHIEGFCPGWQMSFRHWKDQVQGFVLHSSTAATIVDQCRGYMWNIIISKLFQKLITTHEYSAQHVQCRWNNFISVWDAVTMWNKTLNWFRYYFSVLFHT